MHTTFSRRQLLLATAALAAAPAVPAQAVRQRPLAQPAQGAAALSMSGLVNHAARFRGQGLRAAKHFIMVTLAVQADRALDQITIAQRQAAQDLKVLASAELPAAAAAALDALRKEQAAMGHALSAFPGKDSVQAVVTQSDKLDAAAAALVSALLADSKPMTQLLAAAGTLRHRSQRLARNYMVVAAGVDAKPWREQMPVDKAEFTAAKVLLDAAPQNTPACKSQLGLIAGQWTFLEIAMGRRPDTEAIRMVATTSDRIQEVGEELAALYEALASG